MARRISLSQYKSKIRQLESQHKRNINKINQGIRKHNQNVRNYNARVRANQQRLKRELSKLNQHSTTHYISYRTSVITLNSTYSSLDKRSELGNLDSRYNPYLDLSEKETANSVEVLNILSGSGDISNAESQLSDSRIISELQEISVDLDDRWRGAVFALNPNNPDAARHFCTSSREIITQILELKSPNSEVMAIFPECKLTDQGIPTRRSKLKFLLNRKGLTDKDFEAFVDADINNIVELFQIFNDGTHGSAGKFNLYQLSSIKNRVEDGIIFLSQLVS